MSTESSNKEKTDDAAMSDLRTVDEVAAYFKVTHWTIRQRRNLDAAFPMRRFGSCGGCRGVISVGVAR